MPPVGAPRRLVGRLDTLNRTPLGRKPPTAAPVAVKKVKPCCDEPKIEEQDGAKVCKNCYTQISESNIVSDITFQEDSRGAATVQGGFIGENARHARTLGSAAYRRVGGEKNSIQEIEANGRRELAALCPRLHVPETITVQAGAIWSLAAKQNFTAGRRTDEVIAACLYAACRRQKENTVLLMDISEHQKINVFRLGEVYKDLCKSLFLDSENQLGFQRLVEIEPLILKYCRNLEFGDKTRQVAEDAVKIIRRMKRDWITTGRHPAGLCGGAIILAARMNNFRRTVREIVYVSKVADITVAKRVEEFRRTRSAALTVEQFRQYGPQLKEQHDPPSLHLNEQQKEKFEARKRKREAYHASKENTPATEGTATPEPESEADSPSKRRRSSARAATTEPQYDADGFAIPALPIDATDSAAALEVPRRKQSKKDLNKPAPVTHISEEELADEQELEHEIEEVLDNPEVIDTRNDIERAKTEERSRLLADEQKVIDNDRIKARRMSQGVTWFEDQPQRDIITDDDLEAEFANDPEVMNCMLSDEEIRAKEKIWVTYNEDWLRTQHEKELLAKINESNGRKDPRKDPKKGKKKRRSKMGDGTLLAEAGTPIETAADANAAMLAKRAPINFSRYVDYEKLSGIYGRLSSATPTAASSEAGSPPREQTPSVDGDEDGGRHVAFAPSTSRRPAAPARRTKATAKAGAMPTPPATQAENGPEPQPETETYDDEDYDQDDQAEENPYRNTMYGNQDMYDEDGDNDYDEALGEFGSATMGGEDYGEDYY